MLMSDDSWDELSSVPAKQLPCPLLDTLGLTTGQWICFGDAITEFVKMPPLPIDLTSTPAFKAFASLGRCSVAVGLYMAGALKKLHYSREAARVQMMVGKACVLGRLEAGYYFLLSDTFVVPHQFHCWWRLAKVLPGGIKHGSGTCMPPVQNLEVDGGGLPEVEPPPARRAWLPHQQRSFRWMVYRETVRDLFVCESSTSVPVQGSSLELNWKMDKAFDLRGGVLCDPVGSGKTSTMLALILSDTQTLSWSCEVEDAASDLFRASWLTINATLVLCPDHVHEQWIKEVDRALTDNAVEVLPIHTVSELRSVAWKLKALTEESCPNDRPIIVIVALSVIQEPDYQELISPANKDLKAWLQGTDQWRQGLALDCFVWRRLIIDEVHELVHTCSEKCPESCPKAALLRHLRGLKSERRWGLTGTAQELLANPAAVQSLGQIFRTDFNSEDSARRFIEHYCRTNQVDAPVKVQDRLEIIEMTGAEQLIYRQQARDFSTMGLDGTGVHPLSAFELTAVVPLLKLCSHFNIDELQETVGQMQKRQVLTASDVANSMHTMKRSAMDHARNEVDDLNTQECCVMGGEDSKPEAKSVELPAVLLASGLWVEPSIVDGEPKVLVARIEDICASKLPGLQIGDMVTAVGGQPVFPFAKQLLELERELEERIQAHPVDDVLQLEARKLDKRLSLKSAFKDLVLGRARTSEAVVGFSWRCRVKQSVSGPTYLSKQTLASKHTQWKDASSSFLFMHGLWETLGATDELPRRCPVCLETFNAGRSGAVLRCGHLYCDNCNSKMFRSKGKATHQHFCPLCRFPVQPSTDTVDLREFSAKAKDAMGTKTCPMGNDAEHGSKLQRVAEVLRSIISQTKDERAIVFCQFADLELQISSALTHFGIDHARLSAAKDVFEQTAVLDSFQQGRSKSRVLLLSLEQSASGTNLTAANHVLLIHPMAASTPERAIAFEQQAIGRCVRLGQKRKVTVWRFVTKCTVEELLNVRFAEQRHQPVKPKLFNGSTKSFIKGHGPTLTDMSSSGNACRLSEPCGSAREAAQALRQPASQHVEEISEGRLSRTSSRSFQRRSSRRRLAP